MGRWRTITGRWTRRAALAVAALLAVGVIAAMAVNLAERAESAREAADATSAQRPWRVALYDGADPDAWTDLRAADPPRELVLLVHGLDEPGDIWDELAPALADAGHAVARFDYPNDQSLARSAPLLLEALRDLRDGGVRTVRVVAHSMGGLIARDALTREGAYAGDARATDDLPAVETLILLGTPNQGSPWAPLRPLAEIREQAVRFFAQSGWEPPAMLSDGAGEAAVDLEPGSAYLADLSERPRPEHVRIVCVVATWTPSADALPAALRGLIDDLGDGVVPVDSATLDHADKIVRIEANHRGMLRTLPVVGDASAPPPAVPVVLEALRQE